VKSQLPSAACLSSWRNNVWPICSGAALTTWRNTPYPLALAMALRTSCLEVFSELSDICAVGGRKQCSESYEKPVLLAISIIHVIALQAMYP